MYALAAACDEKQAFVSADVELWRHEGWCYLPLFAELELSGGFLEQFHLHTPQSPPELCALPLPDDPLPSPSPLPWSTASSLLAVLESEKKDQAVSLSFACFMSAWPLASEPSGAAAAF
jgi:hypothetical protein